MDVKASEEALEVLLAEVSRDLAQTPPWKLGYCVNKMLIDEAPELAELKIPTHGACDRAGRAGFALLATLCNPFHYSLRAKISCYDWPFWEHLCEKLACVPDAVRTSVLRA
jgi:hypothetical protein